MRSIRVCSLVLTAAALSACTFSPIVLGPARNVNPNPGGAGLISNATALTTVQGAVKAPPAYGPLGGDPFAASAGLIAAGGQNLIAAGGQNYRLQQDAPLGNEDYHPLTGSEVYLADGQGNPLPGIRPVLTNERGEFQFPGVPAGLTYMVVARARTKEGKPVQFKTLVQGNDGRGDIDPATTLATEAITEGAGRDLGKLDPERFRKVRETIREDLAKGGVPDLGDREAVKLRIAALKEQSAELREALDGLRTALQRTEAELERLRQELAARPEPSTPPAVDQPLTCLEAIKLRDKNGDGAVDFDEAGRPERFKELDRNGDGLIQPEEACDRPFPRPEPVDCKTAFAQLDGNGDGVIEIQEFPDGLPGQVGHDAFKARDLNGDMKVTLEEFCRKPDFVVDPVPCDAVFKRADADGDGWLELEQAARLLPTVNKIAIDEPGVQRLAPVEDPMAVAKRLDRNQDGRLSLDEFCGRPDVVIDPVTCEELFKRVDLDGDGIVTYEESAKLDQNETGDPNVRFLKERDADGDGRLTLAEACGVRTRPLPNPCDEKFSFYAGADGVITADEVSPLGWTKDQFYKYDANRDDKVDRAEWGSATCGESVPEPVPVPVTCDDRFRGQAGADGVISYEEAKLAGWADSFRRFDLNADQVVGRLEFGWAFCKEPMPDPTLAPTLAPTVAPTVAPTPNPCDEKFNLAAGRDGVITLNDISALGWTKDQFYKYDANRDDKVDRAEWGVAMCGERVTIQPVLDSATTVTRAI